ncbi:MAG: hypothetical protein ACSHYA_17375 [Opitutaceae bacterium]
MNKVGTHLRFLVLEDDIIARQGLTLDIRDAFPNCGILEIGTARDFLDVLPYLEDEPPDLFISDIMIRTSDLSPHEGTEALKDIPRHYGLLCIREFKKRESLSSIPIIIRSVIKFADIHNELGEFDISSFQVLRKPTLTDELIELMRSLIAERRDLHIQPEKRDIKSKLWNAFDGKFGAGGATIDIKKLFE